MRIIFAVAAVLCAFAGGVRMMNNSQDADEADRLIAFLSSEEIHPLVLEKRLPEYSTGGKNEAVARLARTFSPAPSGKLLTRLPNILTEQNKSDMAFTFVANLRSPDAEARVACLYGLEKLRHPALSDFALMLLRDADDQVVYAACYLLMPEAKAKPRLWKTLQNLYAARKGKKEFYVSMSFLQAQGIESSAPPGK